MTTIPLAADRNACTPMPSICVRWLSVVSPAYACQLVFVAKLTAVLNASPGSTFGKCCGLSGSQTWMRCSR